MSANGTLRTSMLDAEHVRSKGVKRHPGSVRWRPLMTDAVDKVGDSGARQQSIQVRVFESILRTDSYLDSMLLTRPSKNVYRQHRPKADMQHASG